MEDDASRPGHADSDAASTVEQLGARAAKAWMQGDVEQALRDWSAIAEDPRASTDQRAHALTYRAAVGWKLGLIEQARSDFSTVLELPGVSDDHRQKATVGLVRCEVTGLRVEAEEQLRNGQAEAAVGTLSRVLEMDHLHEIDKLEVCQRILDIGQAPRDLKERAERELGRLGPGD